MSLAGYNSRIYIAGTATAFTTEAFTGAGTTWQITSTSKRAWDYSTVPSFFDNGSPILAADIASIDYMFGIVTFTGSKTGPITATGSYIPLLSIAGGYEYTLSFSAVDLDCTEFGDDAFRRTIGLYGCSGSLQLWDVTSTDQDPGAGTRKLQTVYGNKAAILLSIRPDSTSDSAFRVWALLTKVETKAGVADLVASSVDFMSTAVYDSAGRPAFFSYGS